MIEVTGLTVAFGAVRSLNDVTLTFPLGVCGLIGPNGAGKTTFFNVLSGFVKPQSGNVVAFGEDLLARRNFQRARWGLRRTFQTDQAIEGLSVRENILMVLEQSRKRSGSRRLAVVQDALDFTDLAELGDTSVGTLSAAERRRVELARAVVGEPRIVLLDEPAAGLPEEETSRISGMIRQIPDAFGALTILVDHDMDLVTSCCAVTAVLDFGTLVAIGKTDEVLNDPRVVSAYLGNEEVA